LITLFMQIYSGAAKQLLLSDFYTGTIICEMSKSSNFEAATLKLI
jgi:hypothetical protein